MTQEQVWCNTCQEWHNCESWEAAAELNNWGCSLDFNRTRDVSVDEAEVGCVCCPAGRY